MYLDHMVLVIKQMCAMEGFMLRAIFSRSLIRLKSVIACLFVGLLSTADDLDRLVEQELSLSHRLEQVHNRQEYQLAEQRDQLAAVLTELETTRGEHKDLLESLSQEEKVLKDAEATIQNLDQRLARLVRHARSRAAKLRLRIETGIPHQVTERLSQLSEIDRLLASDAVAEQAKGVVALLSFYGDELELSRQTVLTAKKVTTDAGEFYGYHTRLGLAKAFFVSESGRQAGETVAGKSEWNEVSEKQIPQFLILSEQLRGLQVPELAPIPVQVVTEPLASDEAAE